MGSSVTNCTAGQLALRHNNAFRREITTLAADREYLVDMLVEETRAREDLQERVWELDAECAALRVALALSEAGEATAYNEQLIALQRERDALLSAHAAALREVSAQLVQRTIQLDEADRRAEDAAVQAMAYQQEAEVHKAQCVELSDRLREATEEYTHATDAAASQATQYAGLRAEFEKFKAAHAAAQARFAQEKDEMLQTQKQLEHQLDDLRSQNTTLVTQNEDLARELESTKSSLAHTDALNTDLTARLSRAESSLAASEQSVEASEQRAAELTRRAEASEAQLATQSALAAQLEQQVIITASAEARVQELEKENTSLQSNLHAVTIQAQALAETGYDHPAIVDGLRIELATEKGRLGKEKAEVEEKVKTLTQELADAKAKFTAETNGKQSAETQRDAARRDNERLDRALVDAQRQLRESEGLTGELASVVKRQNRALEKLRERLVVQEALQGAEPTCGDSTREATGSSSGSENGSTVSSSPASADTTLRALRGEVKSLRQEREILQAMLAVRSPDLAKPRKGATASPEKENQEKQSQRRSWRHGSILPFP